MMNEKMKKAFSKKRDLGDVEKSAKMDVIKHMRADAAKAMNGKLDGMKKVSVMSNSPAGLKAGLDKAKGILSSHGEQDMLNDSLAPYSDDEHAMDEHMGETGPNSMGQAEPKGYSDGGSVEDYDGSDVEESPDQGDYEMQDQESPAEHDEDQDSDDSDSMSEEEINAKLEKLMRAKQRFSK